MMDRMQAQALIASIVEGRGCLLLGQDYIDGLVESVLTDVVSLSSIQATSLREALSVADISVLTTSMAEYVKSRNVPLLEIASLPWASVISTAVDQGVLDALAGAGASRRLIEASAERIALTTGAHSPATLHLFRALGRIGGTGELSPPNAKNIRSKQLLSLPKTFDALPQLLGTRGVLVVAGMHSSAWMDDHAWAVLGEVFRKIPPARVFWFGWAPPALRNDFAEHIVFHRSRLEGLLAAWNSDAELSSSLAEGRKAVFGVDDHVFTTGVGKDRKAVRFSSKDWRELRRVGSIIDDTELEQLRASASERPRGGLATFVGQAHVGLPDWLAAARGYCFPRDATTSMVEAVASFLPAPKQSLRDSRGGGAMRRPLLLSGPPAIGKSVGRTHSP